MRGRTEVVVIGGGLAGLTAARVLADHGIAVELLEAKPHVGGRAMTMHPDAALPAELGPEYVHGEPDALLALLREIRAEQDPVSETHHVRSGDRLEEEPAIWDRFGKLLSKAPPAARDESALEYMRRVHMTGDDARIFANFVEGFYAAHLDQISIAGVAEDMGGAAGEDDAGQARVRGGYGQVADYLLARILAKHGSVHCGHVVEAIDWSSNVQIAYTTHAGQRGLITADRAVVALPLAVLQQGAVRFHPMLGDHERAMRQIAMGQVVKLVTCFTRRPWPEHMSFLHDPSASFPTFWMRSAGAMHQLTAWAGGPHAEALSRRSANQLATLAITDFAKTLGTSATTIAEAVDHWHFHDYAADPFIRGAYSYTKVGGTDAPAQLAHPLGDRLFFAGEATDPELEGTVGGAVASGQRAARQILQRLTTTRAA